MKNIVLLFFISFFCAHIFAQEENYDMPKPKAPVYLDTDEELPNSAPQTNKKSNTSNSATDSVPPRKFNPSKLRIGGNFGLQFGNYTYVNISPTVGYLFLKDRMEAGAGPVFMYQSFRDPYSNYKESYALYGGDLYARGYIWKGIFAQAQYDLINKESYYDEKRLNVHHLLVGGGYSTPIGGAGSFYVSLLYNVLNNDESVYQGTFGDFPLIMNIGFGIGIGGRR
jgi:hypothetical protein